MKTSAIGVILALGMAVPATAAGVGFNIGGRIPGTGIFAGVQYYSGRYGRRVGVDVAVDGGYYARRKREPRREGEERPAERDTPRRPAPNLSLDVSPGNVWVYLNGVLTDAYGEDRLDLRPGRHRLEFVARGYRTETVDVDVRRAGGDYHVERRLDRLRRDEADDPRLERADRPVSVGEALRRTESLWAPERREEDLGVTGVRGGNPSDR